MYINIFQVKINNKINKTMRDFNDFKEYLTEAVNYIYETPVPMK